MTIINQIKNIKIKQGSSFNDTFIVKDSSGDVQDLTSYTVEAKLARGYASTHTRTDFTAVITSAAAGTITLSLSDQVTDNLDPHTRYVYDIVITYTDSTVTRVFEGIATVDPGVTI